MPEPTRSALPPLLLTATEFPEHVWGPRACVRLGDEATGDPEPVLPDSAVPMTFIELAEALRAIGTRGQEEANLSVDPDDYPLF